MSKEIRVPHGTINTVKKITPEMERVFKEHGLDLHRHDVEKMEDDFGTKERILTVKTRKYFLIKGAS